MSFLETIRTMFFLIHDSVLVFYRKTSEYRHALFRVQSSWVSLTWSSLPILSLTWTLSHISIGGNAALSPNTECFCSFPFAALLDAKIAVGGDEG